MEFILVGIGLIAFAVYMVLLPLILTKKAPEESTILAVVEAAESAVESADVIDSIDII